jgi:hypothetical protein
LTPIGVIRKGPKRPFQTNHASIDLLNASETLAWLPQLKRSTYWIPSNGFSR